jgi:hypothetical protein
VNEGTIKTHFVGDPSGELAAHQKIIASQKEIGQGWKRVAADARAGGQDVNAMLGMMDMEAKKFRESQTRMVQGWSEINAIGRQALQVGREQTQEIEKLRLGFYRLAVSGRKAMQDLIAGQHEEAAASNRAFQQKWANLDQLGAKTRYTIDLMKQLSMASAQAPPGFGRLDAAGRAGRDLFTHMENPWTRVGIAGARTAAGLEEGRDLAEQSKKVEQYNKHVRDAQSLTSGWARELSSVASAYIGVQGLSAFVSAARQSKITVEDRSKNAQMTAAEAHERMFTNVGSNIQAFDMLKGESNAIAIQYGIADQNAMARLMETATSKMAGDARKGAEIARVTAGAKRFSLAREGSQYAIGIANLMQANPGLKPEEASSIRRC